MKTLEMMKLAEQDGKTYKTGDLYYNNRRGFVDRDNEPWSADAFNYLNDLMETTGWEESTVTWQEALKHWAYGGDIEVILEGTEYFYRYGKNLNQLLADDDLPLNAEEITRGTWYILD